jgi:integrase
MTLFRPVYKDPKTGENTKSKVWWFEFSVAGKRYRESTKLRKKVLAAEFAKRRRDEIEQSFSGKAAEDPLRRIRSVSEAVTTYLEHYHLNHRPSSVAFVRSILKNVERFLGPKLLSDLTEPEVLKYIQMRTAEGASGRTVNAELGELARAIGHEWSDLWPRVRKMEERKDVGRALSAEEERRLLEAADASPSALIGTLMRLALSTGMRAGEITALQWSQIDFAREIVTVGRSKTQAGTGREIPMTAELFRTLASHREWFVEQFGEPIPSHFVFPFGSPFPCDPTRGTREIKTAWNTVRRIAGVQCRWHDFRHTAATKMAEHGVSEATMLALMGHMSRAMLERYSHIRLTAKREAVKALDLGPARAISETRLQETLQENGLKRVH